MRRSVTLAAALLAALLVPSALAAARHDDGPRMATSGSMARQNAIAREEGYAFLRTPRDVWTKVEGGELVRIDANGDFELSRGVSFPVARPEVKLFLEQLGAEYRGACGEALVVTSLTRPITRQPANASRLSVHPAGMAIDLRIPPNAACRSWLEGRLLELQAADLLEVIRERRPPHYHVGLFPTAYRRHVERELAIETARLAQLDTRERLRKAHELIDRLGLRDAGDAPRPRPRWAAVLFALPLGLIVWVPAALRAAPTSLRARLSGREAGWWRELGEAVLKG
jgi:hypothetical protein